MCWDLGFLSILSIKFGNWFYWADRAETTEKAGMAENAIFDKKKPEQRDQDAEEHRGAEIIPEQHGDSSACAGAMKLVDSC